MIGLTKTLAIELAPHDVTVDAVYPTAVDTAMTGGIVESAGVTAAFMWLSSEEARYVTGIALPVAAGATAV